MSEEVLAKSLRMRGLFEESLIQLRSVIQQLNELSPVVGQAALLQCFQRAVFLGFKTLKAFLKEEGLSPLTPKQHLEMARQAGWIDAADEDAWWILLRCWLEIPQIYEPEQADLLQRQILACENVLDKLFRVLS